MCFRSFKKKLPDMFLWGLDIETEWSKRNTWCRRNRRYGKIKV